MIYLALVALFVVFFSTAHSTLALATGVLLVGGGLLSEHSWFRNTLATIVGAIVALVITLVLTTLLAHQPWP